MKDSPVTASLPGILPLQGSIDMDTETRHDTSSHAMIFKAATHVGKREIVCGAKVDTPFVKSDHQDWRAETMIVDIEIETYNVQSVPAKHQQHCTQQIGHGTGE